MCVDQQADFDPATSDVPVYATQGGGYATFKGGQYVWLAEIPDFLPDAQIDDPIPKEWGVASANEAASEEAEQLRDHRRYDFDGELLDY